MKIKGYITANWNQWEKRHEFKVWSCNVSEGNKEYTFVGEVEVEFDAPPNEALVAGSVAAWKAEQDRIQAEATLKVNQLQQAINDMLCLEHKPEVSLWCDSDTDGQATRASH